jgi:3-isopropylmalate dehydrogenase
MNKIAVIRGDGIGQEIVDSALEILQAAGYRADYTHLDLGGGRYLKDQTILPDETMEQLRGFDAILLGAVGDPRVKPHIIEQGLLLRLRRELDLYINRRPLHFDDRTVEIIRENTEGLYLDIGEFQDKDTENEIALQTSKNTRKGVERLVRYGFELANSIDDKRITLVHKINVLQYAGGLWQRVFDQVASEYPDVATSYDHIDAACMHLIERPERYSVIVTDNLFGDILTDLGASVSGGIGLASSGNINPGHVSLFEPAHGSAPDIAGQNKANPIATILSACMMLEFLNEEEIAGKIRTAVEKFRTSQQHSSTAETTQKIIDLILL